MKNFHLACSKKLLAVRLISASWAQKRLIPTFYTWCIAVESFMKSFFFEFMKYFRLADSSELLAVRLISASWAQKRLIPTF